MRREIEQYFQILNRFKLNSKNDLRNAWLYLVKTFGLTPNDATDIIDFYMRRNNNISSQGNGLTI